jgi:ABC-type branched-subunit amino acid transport system substrate-binding protein
VRGPQQAGTGGARAARQPAGPITLAGAGGHLFTSAEERVGITPDRINLCAVLPMFLGSAMGFDERDITLYWDWLNDHGGVLGRRVRMAVEDDKLQPSVAVDAMNRCAGRNPFLIVGASFYDVIDAERAWAEQNRELFIHTPAREDPSMHFSFSFQASQETIGALAAQWILRAHAGQSLGVVHRESESWEPGYEAFLRVLRDAGVRPVIDVPTYANQGTYAQQVLALQSSGARVVFVWDDTSLPAIEMIEQAKAQAYHPVWILGPPNFNFTAQQLGDDALHPPIEALTYVLPYTPGSSRGAYAPYGAEIRRFERIYRHYRGHAPTSDFPWAFWVGWQALARGLVRCGAGCTRDELIGLRGWPIDPFCPVRFAGDDHFGGHDLTVARAFRTHGQAAWRPVAGTLCRDRF